MNAEEMLREAAKRYVDVALTGKACGQDIPEAFTAGARKAAFRETEKASKGDIHGGMYDFWMDLTKDPRKSTHRPEPKRVKYVMPGDRPPAPAPKAVAPEPAAAPAAEDGFTLSDTPNETGCTKTRHTRACRCWMAEPKPKAQAEKVKAPSPKPVAAAPPPPAKTKATKAPEPEKRKGVDVVMPAPGRTVSPKGKIQFLIPSLAGAAIKELIEDKTIGVEQKKRGIGFQILITCTPVQAKAMLGIMGHGSQEENWRTLPAIEQMKHARACGIAVERIKEALKGGK